MFRKKIKWALSIALVMTIVIVGAVLAASFAIDTFDTGPLGISVFASAPVATSFDSGTTIVGTERDTQISYSGTSSFSDLRIDFADSNILSLTQGPGSASTTTIQYDGIDGSMLLNYTGLGGQDFTAGGDNDSIVFRIIDNNLPILIILQVYTAQLEYSQITFLTPGLITGGNVDIVIPFTSFIPVTTPGADFANVGAVQLILNGTIFNGSDLSLDFFQTDNVRDYGDLPDVGGSAGPGNYAGLTTLPTGARHIPNGLRMGPNLDAQLDTEIDGLQEAFAGAISGGDDGNPVAGPDDEDGVTRDMSTDWIPGQSVGLNVEIYGCGTNCYLNGWIDWGNDGSFDLPNDQVFINQVVVDGVNALTIPVPFSGYAVGSPVFSRFRLCTASGALPAGCNSLTGETLGGEVEDYWWDFGPTAVELVSIEASTNSVVPFALLAGALILLAGGGAVLAFKRHRM